jgi:AcrR family transcriptional regulator
VRADARANRQEILDAARPLYAERGRSVPMRTVAQSAGVGIATLYRHFPTPEDLLIGVLEDAFTLITRIGEEHLERWDADPARTWNGLVHALGSLDFGALAYSLGPDISGSPDIQRQLDGARNMALQTLHEALDLAVHADLLDPDVTAEQFFAGLAAITRPLPDPVLEALPQQRTWLLDTYVRGMRPTA